MMWEWVCGAGVPLLDNRPYLNISQGTGQRDFLARIFNKLETVMIRSIVKIFIWQRRGQCLHVKCADDYIT